MDPLSLIINAWLGRIIALSGQHDQAIEQLRKTMDLDPTFMLTHYRLGQVYEDKGMYSEAIAEVASAGFVSTPGNHDRTGRGAVRFLEVVDAKNT